MVESYKFGVRKSMVAAAKKDVDEKNLNVEQLKMKFLIDKLQQVQQEVIFYSEYIVNRQCLSLQDCKRVKLFFLHFESCYRENICTSLDYIYLMFKYGKQTYRPASQILNDIYQSVKLILIDRSRDETGQLLFPQTFEGVTQTQLESHIQTLRVAFVFEAYTAKLKFAKNVFAVMNHQKFEQEPGYNQKDGYTTDLRLIDTFYYFAENIAVQDNLAKDLIMFLNLYEGMGKNMKIHFPHQSKGTTCILYGEILSKNLNKLLEIVGKFDSYNKSSKEQKLYCLVSSESWIPSLLFKGSHQFLDRPFEFDQIIGFQKLLIEKAKVDDVINNPNQSEEDKEIETMLRQIQDPFTFKDNQVGNSTRRGLMKRDCIIMRENCICEVEKWLAGKYKDTTPQIQRQFTQLILFVYDPKKEVDRNFHGVEVMSYELPKKVEEEKIEIDEEVADDSAYDGEEDEESMEIQPKVVTGDLQTNKGVCDLIQNVNQAQQEVNQDLFGYANAVQNNFLEEIEFDPLDTLLTPLTCQIIDKGMTNFTSPGMTVADSVVIEIPDSDDDGNAKMASPTQELANLN